MIKTLRKKFVLINMSLVAVIVLAVFAALCVSTYRNALNESDTQLAMALFRRDNGHSPMFEVGKKPPEDFAHSATTFVVKVSSAGGYDLMMAENVSVDDEDIQKIMQEVLSAGQKDGTIKSYNLRYKISDEKGETKVAFIEMTTEQNALRRTVFLSVLLVAAAMVAFFAASVFLSRWALSPVEEAWQRQRQFVADASHELKTPLTVILANTRILKSNKNDTIQSQYQWVKNTEEEATRMKTLVDDLLFLAKTDDAKNLTAHTPTALSSLVLGTALAFEAVAFEENVRLVTENIAPNLATLGDEKQLKQLFAVLIDNAIKYAKKGSAVTLSLTEKQTNAVFTIHNDGEPLSPEDAAHIFERFYRADKSRAPAGYGLGLAIAKSVVDAHGGKIAVDSAPDKGTRFTVTLPIKA